MQAIDSFLTKWTTAERNGDTGALDTRGTYQGHPIPAAVRATLVLVSDADRWKLAAIHMSFIAGTPGAPPIPGAGDRPQGAGGAR